ncbi:MAG: helix-turn-helix transcriptional regulator [Kiloniellales bacterium]
MNKIDKAHVGSDFDAFLAEEGTLAQTTAIALKRVLAWKITQEMKDKNISKVEMARRMRTSRSALDRLLDPANTSVTLHTMDRAATALGGQLRLELVGDAGVVEPISGNKKPVARNAVTKTSG